MSASIAIAGDVPESAYSASYGIPAALLDQVNLTFAFPHDMMNHDSQLFALDTSDAALGAFAHSARTGFMVLAETISGTSLPTRYQAGGAMRAGAMQFGLAARVQHQSEYNVDTYNYPPDYRKRESELEETWFDAVTSAGIVTERFRLDLAFEWIFDRSSVEFAYDAVYLPGTSDSLRISLDTEDDMRVGITTRIAYTSTGGMQLVAFGTWRQPQADLVGSMYGSVPERIFHETQELTNWVAGTLLAFETGSLDWIGVSASWRSDVRPLRVSGYSQAEFQQSSSQGGTITVAARQNVWREWEIRAGISASYRENSSGYVWEDENGRRVNSSTSDSFFQSFSWGTGYQWRRLSFDATLQRQLQVSWLFGSLDVHVAF